MKKIQFLAVFLLLTSYLEAMREPVEIKTEVFKSEFEAKTENLLETARRQETELLNLKQTLYNQRNESLGDEVAFKAIETTSLRKDLASNLNEYLRLKEQYEKLSPIEQEQAENIIKKAQVLEQEITKIESKFTNLGQDLANLKIEQPFLAEELVLDAKDLKNFDSLVDISWTKWMGSGRKTERLLELNRLAYNMISRAAERVSILEQPSQSFMENVTLAIRSTEMIPQQESERVASATKAAMQPFYLQVNTTGALPAIGRRGAIDGELAALNTKYKKVVESINVLNKSLGRFGGSGFPAELTIESIEKLGAIK